MVRAGMSRAKARLRFRVRARVLGSREQSSGA